jgi:hypothetical protein
MHASPAYLDDFVCYVHTTDCTSMLDLRNIPSSNEGTSCSQHSTTRIDNGIRTQVNIYSFDPFNSNRLAWNFRINMRIHKKLGGESQDRQRLADIETTTLWNSFNEYSNYHGSTLSHNETLKLCTTIWWLYQQDIRSSKTFLSPPFKRFHSSENESLISVDGRPKTIWATQRWQLTSDDLPCRIGFHRITHLESFYDSTIELSAAYGYDIQKNRFL